MIDRSNSWNTFWLTTACIFLGVVLGVVLDGFAWSPGTASSYVQQWQTLLGASMAAIGVFVAYKNVSRQIMMQKNVAALGLMSREEDRIERSLPGIIAARMWTYNFSIYMKMWDAGLSSPDDLLRSWEIAYGLSEERDAFGLSKATDELRATIDAQLPMTDEATRQEIFLRINTIYILMRALSHQDTSGGEVRDGGRLLIVDGIEMLSSLRENMRLIIELTERLRKKAKVYEQRAPLLRAKIEQYFNEFDANNDMRREVDIV